MIFNHFWTLKKLVLPVALTDDIAIKYQLVQAHPQDLQFQGIAWHKNPKDEDQERLLYTVTTVMAAVQCLAIPSLRQVAVDECIQMLNAAKIVLLELYTDDKFIGYHKNDDVPSFKMLGRGCVRLRKWSS